MAETATTASRGAKAKLAAIVPVLPIAALALLLRLIGIEGPSFWFDEGLEIGRARLPWPRVLLLDEGPDPPLYRLVLWPIASATTRELWLRLPSVVFSVAAVVLAFRWIDRLGDRRLALLLAAVLAAAPVEVHYAQEVSQYSLAVLLGVCLSIAFERAARRGSALDWVLLTATSAAGLLSYYGLAFLIAALDLDLASRLRRERSRRRLAGFALANLFLVLLATALYELMLAHQLRHFAAGNLRAWFKTAPPWMIARSLLGALESRVVAFFTFPWSDAAPRGLLLVPLALFGAGVVALSARGPTFRRPLYVLATSLSLMWLAHGFGLYPFGFRYALFLTPLYFLVLAAGLGWLAGLGRAGAVAAGGLLVAWLAFLPNLPYGTNPWVTPPHENLRPVLEYVDRRALPDDLVYVHDGAIPAYGVYVLEASRPQILGARGDRSSVDRQVAAIERAVGGRARFWCVLSHLREEDIDGILLGLTRGETGYRLADEIRERRAAAALFVAPRPGEGSSP